MLVRAIEPSPPFWRLRRILLAGVITSVVCAIVTITLVERAFIAPLDDAATERTEIAQARAIARAYVDVGVPAWVVTHPDYPCPQRLAELDVFVDRRDTLDPWGRPMQGYCSTGVYRVVSAGPDGTHGTGDDIVEGR